MSRTLSKAKQQKIERRRRQVALRIEAEAEREGRAISRAIDMQSTRRKHKREITRAVARSL